MIYKIINQNVDQISIRSTPFYAPVYYNEEEMMKDTKYLHYALLNKLNALQKLLF